MAVAFDNSTKSEGTGSRTFNHTIIGSNVGLIVFVGAAKTMLSPTFDVTGVTYNGVALTRVRQDRQTSVKDAASEAWQLAAPATGLNEVVVTLVGATTNVMAVAISFTGTNQSTLVANHNGNIGESVNVSETVTSAVGHFVADMLSLLEGRDPDPVVGTGQTQRERKAGDEPTIAVSTEPGASPDVTMSWTLKYISFSIY